MSDLNSVAITCRLTRDPELRFSPSGVAVCKLGAALNEKYKEKETTVFIDIVVFGKQSEVCNQYLSKGSQIAINGRLSYSSWEKDGQKRSKLEVVANQVTFLGGGDKQTKATDSAEDKSVPF